MKHKDQIKIFIGTTEVAGYYTHLAQGFKELGYNCDYVSFYKNPFQYGGERDGFLSSMIKELRERTKKTNLLGMKVFYLLLRELLKIVFALYAIPRYDVYIFGAGSSLLSSNVDLLVLRMLRKKVISNLAHGGDARPYYIDGARLSDPEKTPTLPDIYRGAKFTKRRVGFHQKFAATIIGAPFSTSHFASLPFINHFALGIPFAASLVTSVSGSDVETNNNTRNRSIRILHSPSNPTAKGTPRIISAIDNLKHKGYDIEFILTHGRANREVLEEIRRCDFVVDQVYSDTPMASFAREAAWFGKPAIVGGYGLDRLRSFVPEGMWPPSLTCHPDEIEQAIEFLITHPEVRIQLGKEAQQFVQEKWSAVEVAKRYLCIIEGTIPDEWWLDPHQVLYLEGCGQSIEQTKKIVRAMIETFGAASLQLDHRPDLLAAFLEFQESPPSKKDD